jgi:hypothetical protein
MVASDKHQLDLFFEYTGRASTIDGKTVTTPHLGGTSGASVWECRELTGGGIWTPERALKIVGVQSAFVRGRYFRAKSWEAVLQLLRQADPALTAIVDANLDSRG